MQLPTNSGDIQRLLNVLDLDGDPVLLPVTPTENALPSECYPNVDKQIQKAGGDQVYGWQLWQTEWLYIEAEFHAVWRDTDGNLHDITPKPNPLVDRILFVPDPGRVYEGRQINNVRLNLSGNRVVDHFIKLNDLKFYMENVGDRAWTHELRFEGREASFYDGLWQLLAEMERYLKGGATPRDPCLCGSGEKYKKCHGRIIDRLVIPEL